MYLRFFSQFVESGRASSIREANSSSGSSDTADIEPFSNWTVLDLVRSVFNLIGLTLCTAEETSSSLSSVRGRSKCRISLNFPKGSFRIDLDVGFIGRCRAFPLRLNLHLGILSSATTHLRANPHDMSNDSPPPHMRAFKITICGEVDNNSILISEIERSCSSVSNKLVVVKYLSTAQVT